MVPNTTASTIGRPLATGCRDAATVPMTPRCHGTVATASRSADTVRRFLLVARCRRITDLRPWLGAEDQLGVSIGCIDVDKPKLITIEHPSSVDQDRLAVPTT